MKTASSHIINKSHGIQNTISHHIKSENYGIIFNILRKQLYTDLILAPIREISANSVDAHFEAGKAKTPIKVTLPTLLDSFFKVRDYGFGLSDDKIAELYSGYGDSNKRGTNDAIGGFGIGKFAPLAYGDSFIINSYQNGTVHSWNSYIDASNRGAMSKMGSAPTTEPNGMEIIVPVKGNDIQAFHEKAANLFAYFDVTPELVNATPEDLQTIERIKTKPVLYSGPNYKFTGENYSSVVVMGGIPYKIDSNVLAGEITTQSKIILDAGVILNFNIGDLEIAASRETLNYSDNTKKKLIKGLQSVVESIINQVNDSFKNCNSLWDAKCLHQEVFDYYGKLYSLRRFFDNSLVYNGTPVTNSCFYNTTDVRIVSYSKNQNYRNLKRVRGFITDTISAHKLNVVIEDDIKASNGVLNRIVPLIESGKQCKSVYVISFADDSTRKKWFDETKFDGEIIKMSSLPKEPLSKYYPSAANANGAKNNKHVKKGFIFNFNFKSSFSSKDSEWYDTTSVDVSNDSGVYLIIDHFKYFDKSGCSHEPCDLKHVYKKFKEQGIEFPTVYCFKNSEASKVKANFKMVLLWDWLHAKIQEVLEEDAETFTRISNLHAWFNHGNDEDALNTSRKTTLFAFAKNSKVENGAIFDFFNHVITCSNEKGYNDFYNFYNLIKCYVSEDVFKPTFDLNAEFKEIALRYPAFAASIKHIPAHSVDKTESKAFDSYFNLVDGV